jgi:hypothetical protein
MTLNPLLPVLLGLGLAGWAAGLAAASRAGAAGPLRGGASAAGAAWAALALAGAALLWPALRLPDGVPSPTSLLARHAPWQNAPAPGTRAADPAAEGDSSAASAVVAAGRWGGNPALADVVYQIEPWLLHLRRELRAGRAPFWNPHQYAGTPFWSNGQSAPLFPPHLLFAALPLQAGLVLLPWLKVMIAGLGARALARELGLSPPAALLAGLIYPLSGMLAGFVLYPMGGALALVPWVLWAVERLAAGRSGPLPLAAAAGLQLLAGHPETALHTALLSGIYLLVRGTARPIDLAPEPLAATAGTAAPGLSAGALWPAPAAYRQPALRAWLGWAAGWTLGAGLAAVQLVPLVVELAASARWQTEGAPFAEPLGRLLAQPLRLVLPDLYGDPARGTWFGPYNYVATAVYAGALALPLAAAGLGRIRERAAAASAVRWDRRWLAVAAVLGFSVAAAYHLPVVRQALAALPVVGRAAHHRLIFGVELALALLAAAGWERWRRGRGGRGLAAGALAAALMLAAAWWLHAGEWAARGLSARQAVWTAWAAVAALLLVAGCRLPDRPRRALALVLPALAALDLLAAHGAINPGLPLDRLYPETPAVRFLQERADLSPGAPGRIAATGATLRPNAAMVYGLFDVRGDDTVKSALWTRFEAEHLGAGHPNYFTPIRRWDSPWLDRLAVRWVMTGPGEPPPPAGLAGAGWRLAYDGADARVWERAGPLPRAWWEGGAPSALAEPRIVDIPGRDDRGGADAALGAASRVETAGRVEVTKSAPGRITLSWAAPRPGLLVVSERHDPGWTARDAGRRLPVHAAGGVLLGVELGPGEGELELVYRPAGIGWGGAASAAALAVVLALVLRRRLTGRSHARPSATATGDGAANDTAAGTRRSRAAGRDPASAPSAAPVASTGAGVESPPAPEETA